MPSLRSMPRLLRPASRQIVPARFRMRRPFVRPRVPLGRCPRCGGRRGDSSSASMLLSHASDDGRLLSGSTGILMDGCCCGPCDCAHLHASLPTAVVADFDYDSVHEFHANGCDGVYHQTLTLHLADDCSYQTDNDPAHFDHVDFMCGDPGFEIYFQAVLGLADATEAAPCYWQFTFRGAGILYGTAGIGSSETRNGPSPLGTWGDGPPDTTYGGQQIRNLVIT